MSDPSQALKHELTSRLIERAHQEWMAALDVVNDPIFLHDKEFCIVRCNKAYQQCAGLPFKQIIGQPYYEVFPRTHAPLRHCRLAMEGAEAGGDEELTVDGKVFRSRSYPIRDEAGDYLYSIHALEDITGRKRDEARLRESEAFIKAILDNLPVGIAVNSAAPPVVFSYMNDNFPAIYRTTRDKLADPDAYWDAVYEDPEFRRQIRQRVLEDCASGDAGRMHWEEIPVTRRGQETTFISARDVPLPEKHSVISMVWDVTERHRAEAALRESRELLLAYIKNSPIYAFIKEVTPTESRVLAASENYVEMIGISAKDMVGKTMQELFPADFAAKITADDWSVITSGEVLHLDEELNGLSYITIKFPIPLGGKTYLAGYTINITERKQHEIAMKRANRALRTISAGNQVLIHATEEGQLLHEMCEVAVQTGGYRMAWIGYVRDDTDGTIEQMAQAGFAEASPDLSLLKCSVDMADACPAGWAVISGATRVVQDVLNDPEGEAWREGARRYGYASCIALPLMDGGHAFGSLVLFDDKVNIFDADEVQLLEEMAGDLAFGILTLRVKAAHREHEQRLQKNMLQTVEAIASIVEMRDPYTSGHQARVAALAREIARQMGLPEEQMRAIHLAGLVHDLGKIQVPAEILSKPGRLTEIEYSMIKMHPKSGYDILKGVDFSWPIAEMVWQHHERLDGSGYPRGLKGEEILPAARILSVADLVEAMSSHRPYRAGLGIDAALNEITRGRGTLFDAQVVDACVTLFREQNYVLPN